MRYWVTVAGRAVEVDLGGPEPRIDGRPVHVDMSEVPGSSLRHMIVDGRSVATVVRPGEDRFMWEVHVDGRRFAAEVLDERARAIREMTGGTMGRRGPRPVRAPMPGLVIRIEVEAGDAVRAGQGLVIVEAMKMENELKADGAGVVSNILVSPGQVVEKGSILVEFEAVAIGAE